MKFSGLARTGAREKPLSIVVPGRDEPVPVVVRPTGALEDAEAQRFASAFARDKGAEKLEPGDARYDVALWAATVATAYLDVDSPAGARQPFFSDPNEVLSGLSTESIAYLFQEQQAWQEKVSPTFKVKTNAELVAAMRLIAEADGEVFFSRCSPFTQLTLARFMAGLLARSPAASSLDGSPSSTSTTTRSAKSSRKAARKGRRPQRRTS